MEWLPYRATIHVALALKIEENNMFSQLALLDLGTPDLVLILLIVLLLFGGKKLPELSKSLGSSVRELKKGMAEVTETKNEFHQQVSRTAGAIDGTKTPVNQKF
jgi:sec-independent protein translocase protein TatA